MKRRGGTVTDGGDAAGKRTGSGAAEVEALCARLMSLVPQEYQLPNSQGSLDLPSQLMNQAASYIKDLRERVEKLKRRRDDCHAKILQVTECSWSDIVMDDDEAPHFEVKFTLNTETTLQLYKVIQAFEHDECIEIIEASYWLVEDDKTVYAIKCRATSSDVVLDASMVATRLRRLFTE